jgi:hypothetical protein
MQTLEKATREKGAERCFFERCIIEYIRWGIGRASFKFDMGDKLREDVKEGKRIKRFLSAL